MTRVLYLVLALLTSTVTVAAGTEPPSLTDAEPIPGFEAYTVAGETTQVIARINGAWFATTENVGVYDSPTILRAFDASLLARRPAIALVVESRDGGSEMGHAIDQLVILCAEIDVLRPCGRIDIGYLAWALAAENRGAYAGGAYSLGKRPHVEVVLEPKLVAPNMLRLTLKRTSSLALPEGEWDRETLDELQALRRSVGLYRMDGDQLVRVK
ncbi:MAG: hypothetical protein ACKV2T_31275 [Kofleriaceae bacterium]